MLIATKETPIYKQCGSHYFKFMGDKKHMVIFDGNENSHINIHDDCNYEYYLNEHPLCLASNKKTFNAAFNKVNKVFRARL